MQDPWVGAFAHVGLSLCSWGCFSRNVPSGEERGERDVFAGYSLWNTLPVPTRSTYCFVIKKKKIHDVQALNVQIDFSWHTSSWIKLMVHAGCIYVKLWSVIFFGTRLYYHHGPCTERIHLTGRNHDQKRVTQKGKEERRRNSFIYNDSFHLNILVGINFLILKFKKLNMKQLLLTRLFGRVPLRWSRSGSVIQDHSDHGRSNESTNPCPEWIHWFIWSTLIQVISDHWSWSGSSERNAPFVNLYYLIEHLTFGMWKLWSGPHLNSVNQTPDSSRRQWPMPE